MARKPSANPIGTSGQCANTSTSFQTSSPKKKVRDAVEVVPADDGRAALPRRSSPLIDTRVVYCGDNLEQLKRLLPREILYEKIARKLAKI